MLRNASSIHIIYYVGVYNRQRQKNRRSILSQGDERWKDVVQELEKELGFVIFSLQFRLIIIIIIII